ncbi:MAG: ATP-dependent helicase UvrD/PcrA, partial [Ilumatobacteraceae bacterium]
MAISCVYCGGQHESSAAVRECWSKSQLQPVHVARALPALGRNLVVRPGQQTPPEWSTAARSTVGLAEVDDPTRLVSLLRAVADDRIPCVFEIGDEAAAALDAEQTNTVPLHQVGPRFTFERSELHHLLWSNSVDGRDGEQAVWHLTDRAVALGANPAEHDVVGDVVLADGTAVWLDGGPIRFTAPIDGIPVVHRIALEHRSLAPFVSNDSTAELAEDQLAAVTHAGGASRVIAPAGSGKTRVLTERARHLLTNWRLPASSVCLVAFNKRAQEEMSTRVADLPGLQVRTLNSIGLA